jgi:hypothetical protein
VHNNWVEFHLGVDSHAKRSGCRGAQPTPRSTGVLAAVIFICTVC